MSSDPIGRCSTLPITWYTHIYDFNTGMFNLNWQRIALTWVFFCVLCVLPYEQFSTLYTVIRRFVYRTIAIVVCVFSRRPAIAADDKVNFYKFVLALFTEDRLLRISKASDQETFDRTTFRDFEKGRKNEAEPEGAGKPFGTSMWGPGTEKTGTRGETQPPGNCGPYCFTGSNLYFSPQ